MTAPQSFDTESLACQHCGKLSRLSADGRVDRCTECGVTGGLRARIFDAIGVHAESMESLDRATGIVAAKARKVLA